MRRILKALILVLTLSVVFAAFTACDITEKKTTLETPTIASQVYTGSKLVAAVPENDGYKVESNEGGTNVGEYDVVLTLTDATKYEWATPDSDDATKVTVKFAVIKATNEITSLTLESWSYGENAKTPVAKAKFGTPTFSYGTTADGKFTDAVPTAAGKYFVKATVAATANYDGAEKIAEFKIAQAAATVTTAPQPMANLVYTGEELALITEGVGNGGTMQYKIGVDGTWSTELPKATNAGEYTIFYKVLGDDDHSDFVAEEGITVTIAKANAQFTTEPLANANLTYSGSQLNLVVAGVVTNGTLEYKLGDGDWSENIPTAVDVGNYKVFYRVVPMDTDNYNGIEQKELNVSVVKAQNEITALSIENWTYGESAKTPIATVKFGTAEFGYSDAADGEFSSNVPTNAGKYFVKATVKGTNNYDEATRTIPFEIAKAAAQTTAPAAKTGLTYNGENQPLVNAGSATGATLKYKLGDGEYSETIPAATYAGEYKVYYKFTADSNHTTIETEEELTVAIAKVAAQVTAPTAKTGLTYNGEAQTLVNAGGATGATIEYKLGNGDYSAEVPSATNAGTYKVTYKVVADSNHTGDDEQTIEVTIAKAEAVFKTEPTAVENLVYSGESLTLVVLGQTDHGTVMYKFADGEWTSETPTAINAGTYSVYYKIDVDSNHIAPAEKNIEVTVAKQQKTISVEETKRVRAELDINNDGSLNSENTLSIDFSAAIGETDYTIVGVNGNTVTSNSVTADLFGYAYGNTTIEFVAETTNYKYTVNLPMLLVSKIIRTVEDYQAWGKIAMACENNGAVDGSHNYGGYFELGNNIASESGAIQMVLADAGAWDDSNKEQGFRGVFDGCGYVIDGIVADSTNEFATFIGVMATSGVLQNIGFTNVVMSGDTFLTRTQYGTIQNVYIQYKQVTVASGRTLLARTDAVVSNVFVDASTAEIADGSQFGFLGTDHAFSNGYAIYGIVPEGYVSYKDCGTSGYGHGFATFALLKAHENAWPAVQKFAAECEYWHINSESGEVSFGR